MSNPFDPVPEVSEAVKQGTDHMFDRLEDLLDKALDRLLNIDVHISISERKQP